MITNKIKKYKIDIGNHPSNPEFGDTRLEYYAGIINVSDFPPYASPSHAEYFWYPIVEWEHWGYGPFFLALHALDKMIEDKKNIYVHCWAGKHRSPMIVYLYLISRGHTEKEVFEMFDTQFQLKMEGETGPIGNWLKRFYDKDIKRNRYATDIVDFMKIARANPELSILHVLELLKGKIIKHEFNLLFEEKK
jgi:hypothetical protein